MPGFSLSRTHLHIQWYEVEFNQDWKVMDSGLSGESVTGTSGDDKQIPLVTSLVDFRATENNNHPV